MPKSWATTFDSQLTLPRILDFQLGSKTLKAKPLCRRISRKSSRLYVITIAPAFLAQSAIKTSFSSVGSFERQLLSFTRMDVTMVAASIQSSKVGVTTRPVRIRGRTNCWMSSCVKES